MTLKCTYVMFCSIQGANGGSNNVTQPTEAVPNIQSENLSIVDTNTECKIKYVLISLVIH
jgi:hypothetical protein